MQLTLHADYSLRVLLFLAERPNDVVSTQEISDAYHISRNHLVRVIQTLAASGFVRVSAGRTGGVTLARQAAEVRVGDVVRSAEPGFRVVECFDPASNTCPIAPVCRLRGALHEALAAFFAVLDRYTLADLIRMPEGKSLAAYFLREITSLNPPHE